MQKILSQIKVDEHSRKPKYRQIVDSIVENIAVENLKVNQKIPSINQLSEEFLLSRDTVEKAYNILKERKIITSVKGKGFYVTRTPLIAQPNVLFLINKLSTYKMQIYNAFRSTIGANYHTDLHVYHCEESLFLNLLSKNEKAYDYYVVMPHFRSAGQRHSSTTEEVTKVLNALPRHKLIVLDNHLLELAEGTTQVYQDFEDDIYQALRQGQDKIAPYRRMVIAYPTQAVYPYPKRILHGFRKFCVEAKKPFAVIERIEEDMTLEAGTLYLTIPESDLVNLVKSARDQGLQPGKDIGIISYNETPLKDLLGISTVSTDFAAMGRKTAELLVGRNRERIRNPFSFTYRDSL